MGTSRSAGGAGSPGGAVDVAVVGGGIIGCAITYALAKNGVSVALVERGSIGREASGASAGLLSPPSSRETPPIKADLTSQSVLAYPRYIAEIEADTGADVGFRLRGELVVTRHEAEADELRALAAWQTKLGFHSDWLDGATARDLEPILPADVVAAVLVREAGSLFSYQLTRAIATAAARHGARVIEQTPALSVVTEGDRVTGLRLPDGLLPAGQVVLAAGSWSASFAPEISRYLPIAPVKGQMLAIADAPVVPQRVIARYGNGYLVPRVDGTVAVGATRERVGFDKRIAPRNVRWNLDVVAEVGPALLDGDIVAMWAGLRPGTPDDMPILGQIPSYRGLWAATGHFHTGIQMGPICGELMASSIMLGALDPRLEFFSPNRFAAVAS